MRIEERTAPRMGKYPLPPAGRQIPVAHGAGERGVFTALEGEGDALGVRSDRSRPRLKRMSRTRARLSLGAAILAAALAAPAWAGKSADVRTDSFRLLSEGVAAYNRGEFKEAVDKLAASSSMALNSYRAYYYLGLALIGDRRYAEAVDALEVALDLDRNEMLAHVALGDAQLKRGDTPEAMAAYYRALKLRAEFSPALDGIARAHEAQGNDERALEFYRRAIASNKGFAEAYVHLGDLFLRQNRLEDAIRLLLEAITIRPDFAPALNRLAVAYNRIGLRNEAVATIRKAIALEPKSADHRATLGEIELALDLPAGAEASFKDALTLEPGHLAAREGMAEIERRRGAYDAALAQLEELLKEPRLEAPVRKRIEERRAAVAVERDRAAALEASASSGAPAPDDLRALAAIYASRGQWERAADTQSRSAPAGAARESLGYYQIRAGRFRAAHEVYSELARGAARADLWVNDGVALAGAGDDAAAAGSFERALGIDPLEPRARLYLGNALLRLGRADDAAAAFKRYAEDHPDGESVERVRRILAEIAPGALPPPLPPAGPVTGPLPEPPNVEASR
jgi:tetratricopeptide (TPR) repeat protein